MGNNTAYIFPPSLKKKKKIIDLLLINVFIFSNVLIILNLRHETRQTFIVKYLKIIRCWCQALASGFSYRW